MQVDQESLLPDYGARLAPLEHLCIYLIMQQIVLERRVKEERRNWFSTFLWNRFSVELESDERSTL
jgi:hypothetical protein